VALTGYLEACLADVPIEVITPRDPAARGAQLSLRHDDAERLLARLAERGVVADYRAPDLIRVAPIPLYTTYDELRQFATILRDVLSTSAEAGS
jgi:kynureninase